MTGAQVFFAMLGLVIPFLSVQAASTIATRRERRMEAMKLFSRIYSQLQELKFASIEVNVNNRYYKEHEETRKLFSDRLEAANLAVNNAFFRIAGDSLAIELMFGSKGDELVAILQSICGYEHFGSDDTPSAVLEDEILDPKIRDAEGKMKALWKSLEQWR